MNEEEPKLRVNKEEIAKLVKKYKKNKEESKVKLRTDKESWLRVTIYLETMGETYPPLMVVVQDPCMVTWVNHVDQTPIVRLNTLRSLLCLLLTHTTPVTSSREKMAHTTGYIVVKRKMMCTLMQMSYN